MTPLLVHVLLCIISTLAGCRHGHGSQEEYGLKVVCIVPAHNEQEGIADTLLALLAQERPPDRIIVAADNCTDQTVAIASTFPVVEVIQTVGNTDKKAGALNQVLGQMHDLADDDFALIVDADTRLAHSWVRIALAAFADPHVGAVGGVFVGDGKNGLLGDLQGLEYARYARQIRRDYGKARVLTGTSTMARMGTFREVKRRRQAGDLPGDGYYNVDAITEDFEFTIAVKRIGLTTVSPSGCTVVTETMPTIRELWKQRVRWQLGALDVITMHGATRITAPYAARQVEAGLGIFTNIAIIVLAAVVAMTGAFILVPFWLVIGGLFLVERTVSAAEYGAKGVFIALTMVADLVFDLFISAVWIWCLVLKATSRKRGWGTASIDAKAQGA